MRYMLMDHPGNVGHIAINHRLINVGYVLVHMRYVSMDVFDVLIGVINRIIEDALYIAYQAQNPGF